MRNRGDGPTYRVVETPSGQFGENWDRAVELGYLNPDQEANDYEWLRLQLGRDPYIGVLVGGDFRVYVYRQVGWEVYFWYHELTAVSWRLR